MALPNETIHLGADPHCPDCGIFLKEKVLHSAPGFYIGTSCPVCGPYTRESHYYIYKDEAEDALDSGTVKYRDAEYHGQKES